MKGEIRSELNESDLISPVRLTLSLDVIERILKNLKKLKCRLKKKATKNPATYAGAERSKA